MEMLKKYFPFAFKPKADIAGLIVNILIHVVICVVIGVALFLLALIPIVGIFTGILGSIAELYIFVSIVLSVLDYLKVLK